MKCICWSWMSCNSYNKNNREATIWSDLNDANIRMYRIPDPNVWMCDLAQFDILNNYVLKVLTRFAVKCIFSVYIYL